VAHVLRLDPTVEDPFSVLSALVPDALCAPLVTPLFPPPAGDSSQTNNPLPINIPPPENPPVPAPVPQPTVGTKYRHWTILRSAPPRGKMKETAEERPPTPEWRKPRPLHTTDFGLFPMLATNPSPGGTPEVLATQEQLFEALCARLEDSLRSETSVDQAATAQSWLQEVVFGGFDGLAYMRSVAEFVTLSSTASVESSNPALAGYVDATVIDELTERRHRAIDAAASKESNAACRNSPVTSDLPLVLPTPLDLGSLISAPNELFDAENVWVGAGANEDSAVLSRALDHAAHLVEQLHELYATRTEPGSTGTDLKSKESADWERDMVTELRMNLIALAKRAPLDQVAKIPSDLVPPHLRHIIPTVER
jgi:bromodomain-containing protein 7